MRRLILSSLVVMCCGAMMVSGCAKKELVKSDEPVVAATPPPPSKQTQQAKPVTETIAAQPIKEIRPEMAQESAGTANADLSALLNKVYFDFDSSALTQPSRDTLSKNAGVLLKDQPSLKVQIEGHCDERGSAEYNLALGERRAKAAMNYLVTLGVKADRLSTISYGKEKPADPGHDESAWTKNRRAEFTAAK